MSGSRPKLRPIVVVDGHWMWTGTIDRDGYGKLGPSMAHRAVWEDLVGPIEDGHELDHLCPFRACVFPGCHESVPKLENLRRGRTWKHWAERTHCKWNHPFAGDNVYVNPQGHRKCRACDRRRHQKKGISG